MLSRCSGYKQCPSNFNKSSKNQEGVVLGAEGGTHQSTSNITHRSLVTLCDSERTKIDKDCVRIRMSLGPKQIFLNS